MHSTHGDTPDEHVPAGPIVDGHRSECRSGDAPRQSPLFPNCHTSDRVQITAKCNSQTNILLQLKLAWKLTREVHIIIVSSKLHRHIHLT